MDHKYTDMDSKDNKYQGSLSSKGTTALIDLPTSSRAIKAKFKYNGKDGQYQKGDVLVTLKNIDNASLLGKSLLFFQYLVCLYTESLSEKLNNTSEVIQLGDIRNREVKLDIDLYMQMFNKHDRKQAIKDFNTYYNTLKSFSLEFEEADIAESRVRKYNLELFGGTVHEIVKRADNYYIILNYDLVKYLTKNPNVTYFPSKAYQMNLMKQPNALSLTNTLAIAYNPKNRVNKGLIKVSELLKELSDIPAEEDIKDRRYTGRIIEPLMDALNYLLKENILEEWYWSNAKSENITETVDISYEALVNKYIHYTFANFEDAEKKLKEAISIVKQNMRIKGEEES